MSRSQDQMVGRSTVRSQFTVLQASESLLGMKQLISANALYFFLTC